MVELENVFTGGSQAKKGAASGPSGRHQEELSESESSTEEEEEHGAEDSQPHTDPQRRFTEGVQICTKVQKVQKFLQKSREYEKSPRRSLFEREVLRRKYIMMRKKY